MPVLDKVQHMTNCWILSYSRLDQITLPKNIKLAIKTTQTSNILMQYIYRNIFFGEFKNQLHAFYVYLSTRSNRVANVRLQRNSDRITK